MALATLLCSQQGSTHCDRLQLPTEYTATAQHLNILCGTNKKGRVSHLPSWVAIAHQARIDDNNDLAVQPPSQHTQSPQLTAGNNYFRQQTSLQQEPKEAALIRCSAAQLLPQRIFRRALIKQQQPQVTTRQQRQQQHSKQPLHDEQPVQ
jgi:hypothetical protein